MIGRGGRRTFVPISRSFLQQTESGGGAAVLSQFVKARRGRALDLYLLVHAVASKPPYDVVLPAIVWARALGMPETESSTVQISTTLSWLEEQRLIRTQRVANRRRIELLSDDGSGFEYRHPGLARSDRVGYFKLPYGYWLDGWSDRMGLPGKAVLLIAVSLQDQFILPHKHAAGWYGLSRDTVRRGLKELVDLELLSVRRWRKRAPLAPNGFTMEHRYTLKGPFASEARKSQARGRAARAAVQ